MRTQRSDSTGKIRQGKPRTTTRSHTPVVTQWESADDDLDVLWEADALDTLPELEREIGISDWLDPQTGEPAEGHSPPHLEA